jgi:mono/diheme cytochrome c family protein
MWKPSILINILTRVPWLIPALILALPGCRQDMYNQPRYKPLAKSLFFSNGISARPLVPGTIPHGFTDLGFSFYTGRRSGAEAIRPPLLGTRPASLGSPPDKEQLAAWLAISAAEASGGLITREANLYTSAFPLPLTLKLVERGQQRFNIYCAVCHDRLGTGDGMIVRKGFSRPPSFHGDRLRAASLGHFFDVITNGFGAMPSYASQVPPADRWAIISYIRALQLSQWALRKDVPRAALESLSALDQGLRPGRAPGGAP